MPAEGKLDKDAGPATASSDDDNQARSQAGLPSALKVRVATKSGQARIAALKVRPKQGSSKDLDWAICLLQTDTEIFTISRPPSVVLPSFQYADDASLFVFMILYLSVFPDVARIALLLFPCSSPLSFFSMSIDCYLSRPHLVAVGGCFS